MPAAADGVLRLLKPPGMTSHDAVDHVRSVFGLRKVGHAGTLDPDATGLLVICFGRATRLVEYFSGDEKAYRAEIHFGFKTDSGDLSGRTIAEQAVVNLEPQKVRAVFPALTGEIDQPVPLFSAVKVKGRRLYDYARSGESVEPPVRRVTIHRLRLLDWLPEENPVALIEVVCSKGTYIRSLCAQIGDLIEIPACMGFLLRFRSGHFEVNHAVTPGELAAAAGDGRLGSVVLSLSEAWGKRPSITVGEEEAKAIGNGVQPAPRPRCRVDEVRNDGADAVLGFIDHRGRFLATARVRPLDEVSGKIFSADLESSGQPLVGFQLDKVFR